MTFDEMDLPYWDQAEQKAVLAYEFYESGAMNRALEELDAAIKLNPENNSLHFNKALILDGLERFEEAIVEYETALEFNRDDPEILNSLGVDYTRIGKYDLAISTFEQIEKIEPEFEPSYCNRIITYTEIGNYDMAEEMFYFAQHINPNCPLCYYNIGNSLFSRDLYKKAVWCWKKTLELEPTHPQINYRIAQGLWADGNYEAARHYFLAELRNAPGCIEVILDFGLFLLEIREFESAKEKFNRILELSPDFAPALHYLGEIALNSSDSYGAVELFTQSIKKDYKITGPRYRLAQCAIAAGNNELAKKYLQQELELVPDDNEVLTSMGSMFLSIGEIDSAVNCLIQALDIDADNSLALYYLGLAAIKRQSLGDAIDFFERSLNAAPSSMLILHDLIKAHLAKNDIEMAEKYIGEVKKIAPINKELLFLQKQIKSAKIRGLLSSGLRKLMPFKLQKLFLNSYSTLG